MGHIGKLYSKLRLVVVVVPTRNIWPTGYSTVFSVHARGRNQRDGCGDQVRDGMVMARIHNAWGSLVVCGLGRAFLCVCLPVCLPAACLSFYLSVYLGNSGATKGSLGSAEPSGQLRVAMGVPSRPEPPRRVLRGGAGAQPGRCHCQGRKFSTHAASLDQGVE